MAATLLTDAELERDRRLVEAHQAGDTSAFGELYGLHYARLVRFCQRKVRDGHLAEELAQETFVKAYRAMSGLEGGRRFYPWLTVIASRLIIDHHRRSDRVQPTPDIETGTVDDTHEALEREVDREQILMALERVRVRHREVLRLRDYEDLSYEAIAQRLGTSPTIVQSLLHRARQALRREYLAVIEHAAVAPLFGGLVALLRRLRHRVGQVALRMPDPGAFGAPLAAATLVVAGALAPVSPASESTPNPAVEEPAAFEASPYVPTVPDALPLTDPAARPAATDDGAGGTDAPVTEVWLGPQGAAQAREHGEQMPTRLDTGLGLVAVDPPAILNDTVDAARGLFGGS